MRDRRLALLLFLVGCRGAVPPGLVFTKPEALQGKGGPVVVGAWQLEDDSRTILEVAADGAAVTARAYTPDDRTEFVITDIRWDGRRLKATFTFPPTGFTTRSDLELIDENTLEGPVTGDYEGFETWHRLKR